MEAKKEKFIQWHPAFCAAMELTFQEDADKLVFEREKPLNTRPLTVDLLVLKKPKGAVLKNHIGRFFRENNILEYKSPDSDLSMAVFYKAMAYACLYVAYGFDAAPVSPGMVEEMPPRGELRRNQRSGKIPPQKGTQAEPILPEGSGEMSLQKNGTRAESVFSQRSGKIPPQNGTKAEPMLPGRSGKMPQHKDESNAKPVPPGSVTVTLVRMGKPVQLMKQLRAQGRTLENPWPGIYYVSADALQIPIQIIVTKDLGEEDGLWLKAIQNDLSKETAAELVRRWGSAGSEHEEQLMDAVMYVSMMANKEAYFTKEVGDVSPGFYAFIKPEIDKAVNRQMEEIRQQMEETQKQIALEQQARIQAEQTAKQAEQTAKQAAKQAAKQEAAANIRNLQNWLLSQKISRTKAEALKEAKLILG